MSVSAEYSSPIDDFNFDGDAYTYSAFMEYGLTDTITIGYDATYSKDSDKYLFYARFPIQQVPGKTRLAFEVGSGTTNGNTAGYLGFMIGNGIEPFGVPGWYMLENRAVFDLEDAIQTYKSDLTVGVTDKKGRKYIGQLLNEYASDREFTTRGRFSIAWPLAKGLHLETGAAIGLINDDTAKLKLGIWRQF